MDGRVTLPLKGGSMTWPIVQANAATKGAMTFSTLSQFIGEFDQELATKGAAGVLRLKPLDLPHGRRRVAAAEVESLLHYMKLASAAYSPALVIASIYPMVPELPGSASGWFQVLQWTLPKGVKLIHAEPSSTWSRPAYFIGVDLKRRCAVLSIRGTASLQDVLTDFAAQEADTPWGPSHKGMLDAAQVVVQEACPRLEEVLERYNLEKVVVVGHSLGAAVATYAALLLEALRTPSASSVSISCYAYGGPGVAHRATAGSPGSGAVSIVSVVNSYDVVPRASYGHFLDLFHKGREEFDSMFEPVNSLLGLFAWQKEVAGSAATASRSSPVKLFPCGQIIHLLPGQGAVYGTQADLEDYRFPPSEDNVHWFPAYEDALRSALNRVRGA